MDFHHDHLKNSPDFSVRIVWNGHEDKPFYRAHLVSASRRHRLEDQPFWGNAVISSGEYGHLLATLERLRLKIDEGSHEDKFGYSMEIRTNGQTGYCYLGLTEETVATLTLMLAALAPKNRPPLQGIIDRLQGIKL
ncbi:MAG: hypothetical protein HY885_16495 [Deltaproteobacteria bacterium]|nr:hypothetical protein [Deltaproteobacteria bacterium]